MYGKRIKELREERGMSQAELAKALNVTQRTVSRFELEQHDLGTEGVIALCRLFEVSADYLLGLEDESGRKLYLAS